MDEVLTTQHLASLWWVLGGIVVAVLGVAAVFGLIHGGDDEADFADMRPNSEPDTDVLPTVRPAPAWHDLTREQRIIADVRARPAATTAELPTIAPSPMVHDAHPRPAPIRVKAVQQPPKAKPAPVTLPVRHTKRLAIEAAPTEAPTDAAAWQAVPGFAAVDALTFAAVAGDFSGVQLDGAAVDIAFEPWDLTASEVDFSASAWTRDGVEALRQRMAASARRELVSAS